MNSDNWINTIRDDFPALKNRRNGRPLVYFDNACTTLIPNQVIEAMNAYYNCYPACGGQRGYDWFAEEVKRRIEGEPDEGIKGVRQIIREFINARLDSEIIFTFNTSHAINLIALSYKFNPGDVVLMTPMEHNSNLIPWLRLQKKGLIQVAYVRFGKDFAFDQESFEKLFANGRVKLVFMALTSNLTGHTISVGEIIRTAHNNGALVLLEGAQRVPHHAIDVQALDVDFLAFSLHKMCGPKGMAFMESAHCWKKGSEARTAPHPLMSPQRWGADASATPHLKTIRS
jgi:cysteine desulfurase/selenocysteine lyase